MSLWSCVKRVFKPTIKINQRNGEEVLISLPSGYAVWMNEQDYELYRGGNYYLVCRFGEDTANIIHFHHHVNSNGVLIWDRDGNLLSSRNNQTKRQVTNPDHLPYDPKMGF